MTRAAPATRAASAARSPSASGSATPAPENAGPVRRTGFTLIEVVVVLAIIAILGAVLVASLARRPADAQAAAIARTLDALGEGVLEYRTDVRRYPSGLRHLSTPPPNGTTDLCGRPLPAPFRASWRGPYVGRVIPAAGFPVGDARVDEAVETEPATFTPGTSGLLVFTVVDVDSVVAIDLEHDYDATEDLGAGTVRWTATGAGQGTLRYALPVTGC